MCTSHAGILAAIVQIKTLKYRLKSIKSVPMAEFHQILIQKTYAKNTALVPVPVEHSIAFKFVLKTDFHWHVGNIRKLLFSDYARTAPGKSKTRIQQRKAFSMLCASKFCKLLTASLATAKIVNTKNSGFFALQKYQFSNFLSCKNIWQPFPAK